MTQINLLMDAGFAKYVRTVVAEQAQTATDCREGLICTQSLSVT